MTLVKSYIVKWCDNRVSKAGRQAMNNDSKILLIPNGWAIVITLQLKWCYGFRRRCRAGSDCRLVASSCSSFLVSKFLQDSPIYEAEQSAHVPW